MECRDGGMRRGPGRPSRWLAPFRWIPGKRGSVRRPQSPPNARIARRPSQESRGNQHLRRFEGCRKRTRDAGSTPGNYAGPQVQAFKEPQVPLHFSDSSLKPLDLQVGGTSWSRILRGCCWRANFDRAGKGERLTGTDLYLVVRDLRGKPDSKSDLMASATLVSRKLWTSRTATFGPSGDTHAIGRENHESMRRQPHGPGRRCGPPSGSLLRAGSFLATPSR